MYSVLSPSSYNVRMRDAAATGCTRTLNASLTLTEPGVVLPSIAGNDTACQSETVTYTTETGKSNYDWSISAGGTITAGGDGSNSVTVEWTNIENQSVSITYEDGGCTPPAPVVLDIWIWKTPTTGPQHHVPSTYGN